MDWFESFYRLDLHDDLTLDQEVDPIPTFEDVATVSERKRLLTLKAKPLDELEGKTGLVRGLQQSRS